jgi:hypothetical protein
MIVKNIFYLICFVFIIVICILCIQRNKNDDVGADSLSSSSDIDQSVSGQNNDEHEIYAYNEYDMNSKYPIGTPNISCTTKNSLTDDEHLYSDKYNGKYTGQTVFML